MFKRFSYNTRLYSSRSSTSPSRRYLAKWAQNVKSKHVQSYVSKADDPYFNLAFEHFLLQNSPADSIILFLYVNRPCAIIGRNQNPWLELNLKLLSENHIDVIRRRSGGGTVFHDHGNVNWTVICPPNNFTRDKHAEMVVRALKHLGCDGVSVNKRHDIVLCDSQRGPLKVSGSAYKLTRTRALHHGTCLLKSENLSNISAYLRSPAQAFIEAKGVGSVRSPVSNLGLDIEDFIRSVRTEFANMYRDGQDDAEQAIIGSELASAEELSEGQKELQSLEWKYLQTPQFTLSSLANEHEAGEESDNPDRSAVPRIQLNVKGGVVVDTDIASQSSIPTDKSGLDSIGDLLAGKSLHDIRDWNAIILEAGQSQELSKLAAWLNRMLPPVPMTAS